MKSNLILISCLFLFAGTTFQNKYEIAKVVKNRIFIVLYNHSNNDKVLIRQLTETIQDLNKNKLADFGNEKLAISFFTDKKFADYKPKDNETYQHWGKSYISEYTNNDKKLVIYPKNLEKLKHVILKSVESYAFLPKPYPPQPSRSKLLY